MNKLLGILIVFTSTGVFSSEDGLEVKTVYGTYKGHLIKSRSGKDIIAFKGIPYAQPPVGYLRFKEPQELNEGNETHESNRDVVCIQEDFFKLHPDSETKYIGSENCLHLNIYSPKNKSSVLLPVFVWIHGGGFVIGDGTETWNGPRYFLDKDRDMVMVTINYRLGILGFLSANDENLPGNLGLKDQTMALKWIKANIKLFGGDPNSVTIGGESAGGASVSHHLESKASKGLFHRAISQSGTADSSWTKRSTRVARRIASNIISFLGCPFDPNSLLECLQDLPVEILLNSQEVLNVPDTYFVMSLVPVIEKDSPTAFMTAQSIEEGSELPWITGVVNEEGLSMFSGLVDLNAAYYNLSIFEEKYKDLLPVFGYYRAASNADEITEKIKQFYFNDGFSEETSGNFVQFLSDRMANHGLLKSARKHKGPVYMYKMSYNSSSNTFATIRPRGMETQLSHGDDLFYFFNTAIAQKDLTENQLEHSEYLLNLWYTFIKNGNPTLNSTWEESNKGTKYLEFTENGPVMSSNLYEERMKFHDQLDQLFNYKAYE